MTHTKRNNQRGGKYRGPGRGQTGFLNGVGRTWFGTRWRTRKKGEKTNEGQRTGERLESCKLSGNKRSGRKSGRGSLEEK